MTDREPTTEATPSPISVLFDGRYALVPYALARGLRQAAVRAQDLVDLRRIYGDDIGVLGDGTRQAPYIVLGENPRRSLPSPTDRPGREDTD